VLQLAVRRLALRNIVAFVRGSLGCVFFGAHSAQLFVAFFAPFFYVWLYASWCFGDPAFHIPSGSFGISILIWL